MFENLKLQPEDKIMALMSLFKADERKEKIDLGVGVYKNNKGQTPIMDAVQKAARILNNTQKTKSYVVIELKKNQTSDDTIGQLSRYMGWIKEHKKDENVKGIIVAGKFDEKLYYAQIRVKDVEIFTYEVNFSLNEYKR